ncbi:MAG: TSUP family transporter, partial [Acidobacteriota bacterium]
MMPIPILILDVAIELLIFLAAVAAGMMNSIAGGGTLVTFPALIWAGLPPITANATNALALVPAGWSSIFVYRQSLREMPRRFTVLVIP